VQLDIRLTQSKRKENPLFYFHQRSEMTP